MSTITVKGKEEEQDLVENHMDELQSISTVNKMSFKTPSYNTILATTGWTPFKVAKEGVSISHFNCSLVTELPMLANPT